MTICRGEGALEQGELAASRRTLGGQAIPAWRINVAFTSAVQLLELWPRSQSVARLNRYGFSGGMSNSVSATHSSTQGWMATGRV